MTDEGDDTGICVYMSGRFTLTLLHEVTQEEITFRFT